METRLLARTELEQCIDTDALAIKLKDAFREYSYRHEIPAQRFFSKLGGPGDMMILAPGLSPGIPAYSVKVNAKFPDQDPGIRGALLLNDLETGALLSIMDSTYITAVRTGLSAAIATDMLARQDARTVAIVGAGKQARFLLRYFSKMRSIELVKVYDSTRTSAVAFVKEMQPELGIGMTVCESLDSAIENADILLTATWSKDPFLSSANVPEGVHITTLGPDQPNEAELTGELIQHANFICDDRALAVSMGAIGGAKLDESSIDAELGEIIGGFKPGRQSTDQITIYGAVGVAFQDLVTAWHVLAKAEKDNIGKLVNFLS